MKTNRSPVELAQGQLEAYNARDINRFCAFFSPDIQVYDAHTRTLLFAGMDAFRERYTQTFANPELLCTVTQRIVQGNIVIDKEEVHGFGDALKEAIAIYHTSENYIVEVHFY